MSVVDIYRRKPNSLHDLHVNPPLQMDLGNTGKVGATDAAQFLKKSGLSDSTLEKVSSTFHTLCCHDTRILTSNPEWPDGSHSSVKAQDSLLGGT
uniref:Uncharacterized protein n=1 Tax=Hucho hucho TaxID=62062 RepID=A0A4W5LZN8_9TELE